MTTSHLLDIPKVNAAHVALHLTHDKLLALENLDLTLGDPLPAGVTRWTANMVNVRLSLEETAALFELRTFTETPDLKITRVSVWARTEARLNDASTEIAQVKAALQKFYCVTEAWLDTPEAILQDEWFTKSGKRLTHPRIGRFKNIAKTILKWQAIGKEFSQKDIAEEHGYEDETIKQDIWEMRQLGLLPFYPARNNTE